MIRVRRGVIRGEEGCDKGERGVIRVKRGVSRGKEGCD